VGKRQALASDYVLAKTITGTLPSGRVFTAPVYQLAPGLKPAGRLLMNGDRSEVYRGATLTLERPYRDDWMLRANATLGDWRWRIGLDFRAHDDPTDVAIGMLGDGFDPTDTNGEIVAQQADGGERKDVFLNSGWSFGVMGSAKIASSKPWSFLVATNISGRQGYPIPYAVRSVGADGQLRWVQASRRGDEFRAPDLYLVDLRLEKDFRHRDVKIATSLEAFNLLDTRVPLQLSRQINGLAGAKVLETMGSRVFRAGVRVSFR
jgi:hypothetical protein